MTLKERPILFNGDMVRAILEGRKTQTRRIVKPQPPVHAIEVFDWRAPHIAESAKADEGCYYNDMDGLHFLCECPHGKPGDRLRISEEVAVKPVCEDWYSVHFAADNLHLERACDVGLMQKIKGYKSGRLRGVHLPPAYARPARLEITGVRVERLNDISEADAIAEGCQCAGVPASLTNRGAFAKLWQTINGPESWAGNPWVWVVEFRKTDSTAPDTTTTTED